MPSLLGMLSLACMVALIICAPYLFSFADRRVGSDKPRPKSTGYGPVMLYALAFVALGKWAALPIVSQASWVLAAMVAGWLVYRSLGWKTGGSMTPRTFPQIFGAYVRHNVPTLAYLGLDRGADYFPWLAPLPAAGVLPFIAFGIFATDRAVSYGRLSAVPFVRQSQLEDANARNEGDRGLAHGLAFLACAVLVLIGSLPSP